MEKIEIKLKDDVAQKYNLVGWSGGHKQLFGSMGIVDINEINLSKADALVKRGFKYLVLKDATSPDIKNEAPPAPQLSAAEKAAAKKVAEKAAKDAAGNNKT